MKRIIVCDTGPLIHLSEAGIINYVKLAGDVFIPKNVAQEFLAKGLNNQLPDWIIEKNLNSSSQKKAIMWQKDIDKGEAAAIALAIQMSADWLLTDDALARRFGQAIGLEIHGSVGLLLWAIATGKVEDESTAIDQLMTLSHTSLWISDKVLFQAHKTIKSFFAK